MSNKLTRALARARNRVSRSDQGAVIEQLQHDVAQLQSAERLESALKKL
jgi:hypothetical protein